ncbi:hypothetical protein ACIQM4_16435 [Streptomyces sp. NPDC091272]|uniref:hypothetical protein n=1 Tax=Streptomyces sp. NPDC091272 TaxID=3365981 RepID=UPI003815E34B
MRSSAAPPRRNRLTGAVCAAAVLALGGSATAAGSAYAAQGGTEQARAGHIPNDRGAQVAYESAGDAASAGPTGLTAGEATPAEDERSQQDAAPPEGASPVEDGPSLADGSPLEDGPPAEGELPAGDGLAAEGGLPPGDGLATEDGLPTGEQPSTGERLPAGEQPSAGEQPPTGEHPSAGGLEFNPATASPGDVVTVNTTVCGPGEHGTGNASSLSLGDFTMRTSTHQEVLVGQFTVPAHTAEGDYTISVSCADGHKSAKGTLWVTADGGPSPGPAHPDHPTGHVRTGVGGGTSAVPGTPQIAAGAAFLAASAVGGTWLLRRRASGTR